MVSRPHTQDNAGIWTWRIFGRSFYQLIDAKLAVVGLVAGFINGNHGRSRVLIIGHRKDGGGMVWCVDAWVHAFCLSLFERGLLTGLHCSGQRGFFCSVQAVAEGPYLSAKSIEGRHDCVGRGKGEVLIPGRDNQ
jgi:hypothetical protein